MEGYSRLVRWAENVLWVPVTIPQHVVPSEHPRASVNVV